MKIIVAPDKFKGSLTAMEVCRSIQKGIHDVAQDADVRLIPLADGGEGSLDVLVDVLQLTFVEIKVRDPLFRPVTAGYGIKGENAYIELAAASGLQLLTETERKAIKTSTVGVGEMMRDALKRGAKNIHLFVGGSATNDGGMGMAHGLGFRFLDGSGNELSPIGENLARIRKIRGDIPGDFMLAIVTDVQNELLGPEGASHVYGPQKGADENDVKLLEGGLRHFSALIEERCGKNIAEIPGTGAAGGIGLCGIGLLGGSIEGGIDTFLRITNFREALSGADLVITGEGKLDTQTLHGKVVAGVSQMAREFDIPVVAVCGVSELRGEDLDQVYIREVLQIKSPDMTVEYSMRNAAELIRKKVADLLTACW